MNTVSTTLSVKDHKYRKCQCCQLCSSQKLLATLIMPLKVHLKIKDISVYKNVPESFAASLEIEFCRIGTSFKYSSAQFEESWLTIEVVVEYVTGFDKLRSLEDVADEVSFSFEFSNSWDHWFALQIIKCLMIWCIIQYFKSNCSKAEKLYDKHCNIVCILI